MRRYHSSSRNSTLAFALSIHQIACAFGLLLALALPSLAQQSVGAATAPPETEFASSFVSAPLPEDTGARGLQQVLLRLGTTARLLHTTAHPDDEDGGMLVLESRGHGATIQQLTLNRGEGGQNKIGSNLFDVLGVLRTLELLAADRYYAVQQRFTRVADFGFSKSAEETFEKWGGHDPALGDMVRVIRTFRPDVIVSRFQGNARDGHGHHQAAGILTREAFRAAADPQRFPDQIVAGLHPWQAQKLYIDNVRGSEDYTLALDSGINAPQLGMTFAQFAMQGLRFQLSQGAGSWKLPPGPHVTYYKLVDSVLPPLPPGTREQDFFDRIDTTLPGLASRLGPEEAAVPFLRPALVRLQELVNRATELAPQSPTKAAAPLLDGLKLCREILAQVENSSLPPRAKADLRANLRTKQEQFQQAANLAAGVVLSAEAIRPPEAASDSVFVAVPGGMLGMVVKLSNQGTEPLSNVTISPALPPGWSATAQPFAQLLPGRSVEARFSIQVAPDAQLTRPVEHRADPERDALYIVDNPASATLPFPNPEIGAAASYQLDGRTGTVSTVAEVRQPASDGGSLQMPVPVAPAFSLSLEPSTQIIPVGRSTPVTLNAVVTDNTDLHETRLNMLQLQLDLPPGFTANLPSAPLHFSHTGQQVRLPILVNPAASVPESRVEIRASVKQDGRSYGEGYTLVGRPDIGGFLYFQPAVQRVSVVDVKIQPGLKVGYIMGAGDDIPAVLRQLGIDLHLITPAELAAGDLSQWSTIVLGIRAYDTRPEVGESNSRLLDFVKKGGTLIVQYNADVARFNQGHYTPYPATLARDRVTDENAPVHRLAPQDPLLNTPNRITQGDFQNWVQERGLYFMHEWDTHFEAPLETHDPGSEPLQGGLLRARFGQGTYIYTGYAFFRQLPAGNPGAIRLFVNLLSSGRLGISNAKPPSSRPPHPISIPFLQAEWPVIPNRLILWRVSPPIQLLRYGWRM